MIRLVDIHAQNAEIRAELDDALREVVDFGAFVLGPMAASFEEEFGTYLDVAHVVACNSGTDALLLAGDIVRETGGPGEIITSPFTFFATAEAILQSGHEVVFADIDPNSFNLDPDAVGAALGPKTVAVMPVHLYGRCADVGTIMAAAPETVVIEDAAQAVGATGPDGAAGSLGHMAGFSFYPTKNLGAMGDAGALTTDDDAMAALARSLRAHGEQKSEGARTYHYERLGRNSRMDGFQGAVLRVKLRKLPAWHDRRISNARFYDDALGGLDGVTTPDPGEGRHVYHQYAIRAQRRDELAAHLAENGVETRIFYPEPLHLAPALAELGCKQRQFPEAERAAREVLSLPVHPHLEPGDREKVVEEIRAFFGG